MRYVFVTMIAAYLHSRELASRMDPLVSVGSVASAKSMRPALVAGLK